MTIKSTDTEELSPGDRLDNFTIEKKIGEGGMAIIYLAHDDNNNQQVLKIPRLRYGDDPVSKVAFENELRLAPYLEDFPHAYMPKVQSSHGSKYLVMDYIEGVDLWTHLSDNGCLSEDEAISLMKKIVTAVKELHRRRIVHLDIKLSNIMVTTDGEVRLVDFGLANHIDLPDLIYESFHQPKGTPAYIAPEQFIGVRDDFRSDIFSLGVMLFEITTNKLPFTEGTTELDVIRRIRKKVDLPIKYNSSLSAAFNYVVGGCLHANPDLRFMDAAHLLNMLDFWEGILPLDRIMGCDNKKKKAPKSRNSTKLLKPAYRVLKNLFDSTPDNFQRLKQWAEYRKKAQSKRPKRILVAIDLGMEPSLEDLHLELLQEACFLAKLQHTYITVITVLSQDVGMASGEKEMQELNDRSNRARKVIEELVASVDYGDTPIGINVHTGGVVNSINNCIENYKIDLLLIGERKIRDFSHYMKNNNGNQILVSAECSVLIVRNGQFLYSKDTSQEETDPEYTEIKARLQARP